MAVRGNEVIVLLAECRRSILGRSHAGIRGLTSDNSVIRSISKVLGYLLGLARIQSNNNQYFQLVTLRFWRRRRDSNPRYPFEVYSLSRGAPSATRPRLQIRQNALKYGVFTSNASDGVRLCVEMTNCARGSHLEARYIGSLWTTIKPSEDAQAGPPASQSGISPPSML